MNTDKNSLNSHLCSSAFICGSLFFALVLSIQITESPPASRPSSERTAPVKWHLLPLLFVLSPAVAPAAGFELKKGDHVCIIGNTLADRMQHFGWLETLIHARYPKHELVFRNLGYSGDELTVRLRPIPSGSPDGWRPATPPPPQRNRLNRDAPVRANRFELTNTKADVIFAFFGYNESWAGAAGI